MALVPAAGVVFSAGAPHARGDRRARLRERRAPGSRRRARSHRMVATPVPVWLDCRVPSCRRHPTPTREPSMIDPRDAAPENPERWWRENLYKPGAAQLTVRAVLVGMPSAPSCVSPTSTSSSRPVGPWASRSRRRSCSFAIFQLFHGVRPRSAMGPSARSARSRTTRHHRVLRRRIRDGGGNMAAFGALLMVTTLRPNPTAMIFWFGAIAALGVFTAIPIKRQLINHEGLAFPTGKATGDAERDPRRRRRPVAAGTAGARARPRRLFAALRRVVPRREGAFMPFNHPGTFLPVVHDRRPARVRLDTIAHQDRGRADRRRALDELPHRLVAAARRAADLRVPRAVVAKGVIATVSYKAIVGWTVWPGAAILVASGLTSFALDWKSVAVRSAAWARCSAKRTRERRSDGRDRVPGLVVPGGLRDPRSDRRVPHDAAVPDSVVGGLIAVPLMVVMGFVAARVTGETDVTPTKALGPVTQLVYGAMTPGNLSGNIMSANVTGGIGLHAADLLTTLKTGWMLGASPRVQFYAQLFGVLAGAAVVVPAFNILIPDPTVLGSDAARAVVPRVGRRVEGVRRRTRRARRPARAGASASARARRRARDARALRAHVAQGVRAVAQRPRHRDGRAGQQRDRDVHRRARRQRSRSRRIPSSRASTSSRCRRASSRARASWASRSRC